VALCADAPHADAGEPGARLLAGLIVAALAEDCGETQWRSWVDVEVLVPVVAGGVERVMDVIPRGARGLLEQKAHVPALVGGRRCLAKLVGDGGQQCVGPVPRACDVDDDRGERHHTRS
jgi:hypothetical protein